MRKVGIALCSLALLVSSCVDFDGARDEAEQAAKNLWVGMTREEVKAALGEPLIAPTVEATKEVWSYLYVSGGYPAPSVASLSVTFEKGRVVDWTMH